jgi:predicted nucleic acid-binding protein
MKKILVDTSIWIEYFKGKKSVQEIIHDQKNYEIYITGPIITELIQGLKTEKEKDRFTMCINTLPKLQIDDDDWVNAGNTGNSLRKKGVTVPLPDLIIFSIAKKNNCALFTLDRHFQIIKETIQTDLDIIQI